MVTARYANNLSIDWPTCFEIANNNGDPCLQPTNWLESKKRVFEFLENKRQTDSYSRSEFNRRGYDYICPSVFLKTPSGDPLLDTFWQRVVSASVRAPELLDAEIERSWSVYINS